MRLESPSFRDGGVIPKHHSRSDRDLSPGLKWSEVPAGTKSLALICDDPDAPRGTWVHWVFLDIPPGAPGLPEGIEKSERPKGGGVQGKNDFGEVGWGGPAPPSGTHRYQFRLYALDAELKLPPGMTKAKALEAMRGHVLEEAKLTGKYSRL